MNIQDIAKICHQANKAYCETIGDNSQKDWHNAPDWQKESAVKGVQHIIDNPESTPEDSHKSWLSVKEAEGWTYGKYKDEQKKTHPCFKPYSELPEDQKKKDLIFTTIAKTLTKEI